MGAVKTHTGIVITRDGEKRMEIHETASSWVVGRNESYDKATGRRWGAPAMRRRLVLDSIEVIGEEDRKRG
ncbi:hypothetical protein [Enterobacter soli]|uniref:hypothetical protein n=1 Tax=Enterobacter soli TaxID=885040 RepID=UPI002F404BB0